MGTVTIMSVPFCTFAEIYIQVREKLSVIFFSMQIVQFKSQEQKQLKFL